MAKAERGVAEESDVYRITWQVVVDVAAEPKATRSKKPQPKEQDRERFVYYVEHKGSEEVKGPYDRYQDAKRHAVSLLPGTKGPS